MQSESHPVICGKSSKHSRLRVVVMCVQNEDICIGCLRTVASKWRFVHIFQKGSF